MTPSNLYSPELNPAPSTLFCLFGHHEYSVEEKAEFKDILSRLVWKTPLTFDQIFISNDDLSTHPLNTKEFLTRHSREADSIKSLDEFRDIHYGVAKAENQAFDTTWPPALAEFGTAEYWGLEEEGDNL